MSRAEAVPVQPRIDPVGEEHAGARVVHEILRAHIHLVTLGGGTVSRAPWPPAVQAGRGVPSRKVFHARSANPAPACS